jgi:hypothetical protein
VSFRHGDKSTHTAGSIGMDVMFHGDSYLNLIIRGRELSPEKEKGEDPQ